MVSYQKLVNYCRKKKYKISIKKNYFVISIPKFDYHITVFQDQWDDYEKDSGRPYHLFHISSDKEENRCSSYFWVNKNNNRIQNIPKEFFSYNQPNYSFYASTRSPCPYKSIKKLLRTFQKMLNKIPKN